MIHLLSQKKNTSQNGFVLVYAVLVAGILLSVGIGIFAITLKEITLSRYGRESQVALSLADTGLECAIYADFILTNVFATSSESVAGDPVQCDGEDVAVSFVEPRRPTSASSTFTKVLPNGGCTIVEVGKYDSGDTTVIDSRGFNTCDANSPTRVERGLRLRF